MGGVLHIRIGLDTAHYSESGRDTAHNTTYYSAKVRIQDGAEYGNM